MANNRISGLTVEIGGDTVGLNKALSETNKSIRQTAGQLKDVERLLKLDPHNVELIAQKQRLMAEAAEETGEKLESLKDAEQQVQAQFRRGDIGQEQYDALKREIIATERQLDGFKTGARQAETALNGIDEDPVEDVEDSAKKADKALDGATSGASAFGDVLKAGIVLDGVKALAGWVSDLTEQTTEYRKVIGTLEVSSEAAGYTATETSAAFKKLYGVLGDEQTAATTLANLQAIGYEQDDLLTMISSVTGAWATYGDSIPIDGLAEAVNETIKTGKVTGVFADVLNWAGKNEESFNELLGGTADESERARIVMAEFASQGLDRAGKAWEQNNEDIVEANKAQAEWLENASEIATQIAPVTNTIKGLGTDLLGWIADMTAGVDWSGVADGIESVEEAAQTAWGYLFGEAGIITDFFEGLSPAMDDLEESTEAVSGYLADMGEALKPIGDAFDGSTLESMENMRWLLNDIADFSNDISPDAMNILLGISEGIGAVWSALEPILSWTSEMQTGGMQAALSTEEYIAKEIMRQLSGMVSTTRALFTGDWDELWEQWDLDLTERMEDAIELMADWAEAAGLDGDAFTTAMTDAVNNGINTINGLIDSFIGCYNFIAGYINDIVDSLPPWVPNWVKNRVFFDMGQITGDYHIPNIGGGSGSSSGSYTAPDLNSGTRGILSGSAGGYQLPAGNLVGLQQAARPNVNFTQNIYSPTPLNTYEIYIRGQQATRHIERVVGR